MNEGSTRYFIPAETTRSRIEVKRSRFIATAAFTPSIETSDTFISAVKAEFPDANHNCWTRVIGAPGDTSQAGMSDDGEPQGAAGRPMLTALLHTDVGDISVVVSRYFGGINLGKGGMARAYTDALLEVLEQLPRKEKIFYLPLKIQVPYPLLDTLDRILPEYETLIDTRDFGASVTLNLKVPAEKHPELIRHLTELSGGKIEIGEGQHKLDS
jgi:uncharacterized YigZ family protein